MKQGNSFPPYVFVGHDFDNRGGRRRRFREAVEQAFAGTSYVAGYADTPCFPGDGTGVGSLLEMVCRKIRRAEFCIFDLTGFRGDRLRANLNVLLELGISIGYRKTGYFLFKQGSVDVARELSDLVGEFRYTYRNQADLAEQIRQIIQSYENETMRTVRKQR